MPALEPKLRQKQNGAYFVRWGGKDHYLSTDLATARKLFSAPDSTHPGARSAWLRWKLSNPPTPARGARGRLSRGPLIIDLAREFLAGYEAAGRPKAAAYYRTHLARFLDLHGEAALLTLTTADPSAGLFQPPIVPLLNAYRADMQATRTRRPGAAPSPADPRKFAPKTINHDLTAIKRLFAFAAELGRCPPVSFKAVRKLPVQRGQPEDLRPLQLFAVFAQAHRADPHLVPYMALNYLTLARPSEVVELVMATRRHIRLPDQRYRRKPAPPRPQHARAGHFLPVIDQHGQLIHPRGLFSLGQHKNSWRDDGQSQEGPARYLVLTDQALLWLEQAVPIWSTLDSYSAAVARAVPGFGPRQLRDSAASHLRERGAGLEDVQILLGHSPRGEWPSYARTPWPAIRDLAARLSL